MDSLLRDLRWCEKGKGLVEGHGNGDEEGCGDRCVWVWVLAGRVRVCIYSMGLIEQIVHQTRF